SRRGSALGGADRDLDFRPLASVLTLFDEAASLIHADCHRQREQRQASHLDTDEMCCTRRRL
ncbi:MAG: hypothetical protein AAFX99_33420, partial [Myxococcota bacterium]